MWYFSCKIDPLIKIIFGRYFDFYDFRISQRRIGSYKMRSFIDISIFPNSRWVFRMFLWFHPEFQFLRTFMVAKTLDWPFVRKLVEQKILETMQDHKNPQSPSLSVRLTWIYIILFLSKVHHGGIFVYVHECSYHPHSV